MKPILVLYATREGQTRRIAEHVVATIRAHGLEAQLMDAARLPGPVELREYQAVVLAASVHAGKHEPEMVRFVKDHRSELEQLPTVFLSTSLSEAGAEDPARSEAERARAHALVEQMMEAFFAKTGFRPTVHKPIAGALLYTQYNWLIRLVMKRISKSEGGSTDTSRDHEYTNWIELDRFIAQLVSAGFRAASQAPSPAAAAPPT